MSKHIHAESMLQYAQDAMETDKPSLRWQYNLGAGWISYCGGSPSWETDYQYRRKPQTVTISGFEVPAPLKAFKAEYYYVESPACRELYWEAKKGDSKLDSCRLERGIAHSTKEGAIASCKARLGIDPEEK